MDRARNLWRGAGIAHLDAGGKGIEPKCNSLSRSSSASIGRQPQFDEPRGRRSGRQNINSQL